MPKWVSRRVSILSACRLSIPSFLKNSSSGEREPAGTLKCEEASCKTSAVVCSSVRIPTKSTIAGTGMKIRRIRVAEVLDEGLEKDQTMAHGDGNSLRACRRPQLAQNRRNVK